MKLPSKKTSPPKPIRKKGIWTPGFMSYGSTYDAFQSLPEPSKFDLVRAYEDITFACVSLIATNIACVPIRLYVKTGTGQTQPKYATRNVQRKCLQAVKAKALNAKVQEVLEHPLLSLLDKCNAYHNKHDLIGLTQIYLDLTGNAYWLMQPNGLGIPRELYLLPSQFMTPERDEKYFITGWRFGQGSIQQTYTKDEVLHFKQWNPADPYGEGVSPLRAAWQRRIIGSKELAYLDNVLTNQARPDGVLAIKDSVSPFEAERLAKEWQQRYRTHGEGGVLVVDGTMNFAPLNYSPKDYAELQLFQVIKNTISNCFHIPPEIWELGESNRATADTAEYLFALRCLKPRLETLVQRLNDYLVPFFDNRFFFAADPIVPEDREFEKNLLTTGLQSGAITRNEWREHYGFNSEDWGEEPLLPSGSLPASSQTPAPPEEAPKDRTQEAAAVLTLQQAYFSGQLDRTAAVAHASLFYGLSPAECEALFPPLPEPPAPPPEEAPPDAPPPEAPPPEESPPEESPPEEAPPEAPEDTNQGKTLPTAEQHQDDKELVPQCKELKPEAPPEEKETEEQPCDIEQS